MNCFDWLTWNRVVESWYGNQDADCHWRQRDISSPAQFDCFLLRMVVLTKRWPYSEETFLRTFAAQRFVDEDLLRVDAQPARFALARHVDHQQHQIGMRYFVDAERPSALTGEAVGVAVGQPSFDGARSFGSAFLEESIGLQRIQVHCLSQGRGRVLLM